MTRSSTWLLDHKRDVHSQTGEDGIIEKILEVLPETDHWCVEFGAWDGQHLTNTGHLIESKGYSAILIEADEAKFRELQHYHADSSRVITMNELVGFSAEDGLDKILASTTIPRDFDLLSIDIDGNDYHVWKAVSQYRPKVVVIEFNPTIPTQIHFIQPADPAISQGTGLRPLVELGKEMGYELISVLPFNAFFVRREYFDLFGIECNDPRVLRTDSDSITYLFSGFDGTIFLDGCRRLPWHDVELDESQFQYVPAHLRAYPGRYTPRQQKAFRRWVGWVRRPGGVANKIRRFVDRMLLRYL